MPEPAAKMQVVISDIDMSFMSMVFFIVKWTVASIPALIILFLLGTIAAVFLGGIFRGMFAPLGR
jgi:hypothetical protein